MQNKKSPSRAFEILWLVIALMTLFTGVHKSVFHGIGASWYFFGFTFLALAMYLMRKSLRKKSEKENSE